MRRQLSDSAVISTGKPARVYMKVTSWSRVGPPRTLTRSGLRLTKRGIGRPLLGPVPNSPAARAVAAQISAAIKARAVTGARRTIRQLRFEFIGSGRRKNHAADWLTRGPRRPRCRPLSSHVHLLQRDPNPRKERQCPAWGLKRPERRNPFAGWRGGEGRTMSSRKKPLVVVTRKLPDSIETRMRELFDARLNLDDTPMTPEQIADAVRSADILVPTVTDEITEELLKDPDCKLRLIANFGNGVDNIDVVAAHARGITVTNTPKVLTEDTADMTMALILAVPRRLIEGASILTEGKNWPGWSPTWMLGHRIGGKRLGIIGIGRIGQAVARRARAFGLQIHYHNRRPVAPRIAEELGATYWESLDQMLARMDIISVNCPHTPATFHLLSARRLKLIRKDAYIVNTARGGVIDEDTLIKLIEAGEIGGPR